LLQLGSTISVANVIAKFDGVFGDVLPAEKLMEQFYSARQKDGETAAIWACRLEDILAKLRSRSPHVTMSATQEMLRTKFWSGLSSETLKNALRHKHDSGIPYGELLVAARICELESRAEPQVKVKVNQQAAGPPDKMDALLKQMQDLQERLTRIEASSRSSPSPVHPPFADRSGAQPRRFHGKCFKCNQYGHRAADCLNA
jgi:hypothetical protein